MKHEIRYGSGGSKTKHEIRYGSLGQQVEHEIRFETVWNTNFLMEYLKNILKQW